MREEHSVINGILVPGTHGKVGAVLQSRYACCADREFMIG